MKNIKADFWYNRSGITFLPLVYKYSICFGGKIIWACSHDSQVGNKGFLDKVDSRSQLKIIKILKKTHCNIFQTYNQLNLAHKSFNLLGNVIYNSHPITIEHYNPDRKNHILWIGRLQTWKHPERFLLLAQMLKKYNFEFRMIGIPVSKKIFEKVISFSYKATNFKYLGEKSSLEIVKELNIAKLLICTSKYEGFPNTFIEAWLRGVPIVSLSVDPDNLLQKEKLGMRSGSLNKMKEDIVFLMKNKNTWKEMSLHCKKYSTNNFDIKKAVTLLEKNVLKN